MLPFCSPSHLSHSISLFHSFPPLLWFTHAFQLPSLITKFVGTPTVLRCLVPHGWLHPAKGLLSWQQGSRGLNPLLLMTKQVPPQRAETVGRKLGEAKKAQCESPQLHTRRWKSVQLVLCVQLTAKVLSLKVVLIDYKNNSWKHSMKAKDGELAPAERICEEEGLTCLFRRQLLWQGLVRRGNERCSSNAHLGLLDAHVYFCQPFHLSALLKTQPLWRDI